jgi:hypothetical protein
MTTADDILQLIERRQMAGRVKVGARHHERAGKPYRPGSGTEGMAFDERWCEHCTRDRPYRGDPDNLDPGFHGCQIIADVFAFEVTDQRYPKEWVYDREGRPCCTAFTTDPTKPVRCDKTIDMFEPKP